MDFSKLRDTYFPRIKEVIPDTVNDHLEEMRASVEFNSYVRYSPDYSGELAETLLNHSQALFYPNNQYRDFIKTSDEKAFDLGIQFAATNFFTIDIILRLTHSTRMCSIRRVLNVLSGNEITLENSVIIERLYELANTRQNAFCKGYIHKQNEKLRTQSYTDPLTGLYNRRYFYKSVPVELTRAHRTNCPLTLMLIDLNNLKDINDEFGHIEGDKLLEQFAMSVSKIRADFDSVFRFGGDEFVVLVPNCNAANAEEIGARLNQELSKYNPKASLSYGVAELPLDVSPEEVNIDKYIKIADMRMYSYKARYKEQGRYMCVEK